MAAVLQTLSQFEDYQVTKSLPGKLVLWYTLSASLYPACFPGAFSHDEIQ